MLTYEKGNNDIQISFHKLQSAAHQGTLIFLDDVSTLKQKMQQQKLASLGKLTANIAHEIRNPLGAISHAAQLLAENKDLPSTEQRLTEIIQQHSIRINDIIEDIMQMSRGRVADKNHIELKHWIENFINNFCLGSQATQDDFKLQIDSDDLHIEFDNGHLNRILTNLCNNAKIHGNSELPVYIKIYKNDKQSICVEIADQGPGIESPEMDKIFEPFYTTGHKGSGLGLYIVSQLCELNDCGITVSTNEYGGTSFIICK
ncbi:MAG: HAMP domain-containing histidine kinase [Gammaproteobacteria bacterium]|nr:HAMP domain-containing histidine kinase [Gammaproteobacteria bacterium]